MMCIALSGSMPLQVVSKLRNLHRSTQPGTYERAQATLPMVAELEDDLDGVLNSVGLNGVLMLARLENENIPSADRLRYYYTLFKQRLHNEPLFMKQVIDTLPAIAARYETTDFTVILADKDFLDLLVR